MFRDFNIQAILVLIVISLSFFCFHRLGFLDVSLRLNQASNHHGISSFSIGDVQTRLKKQSRSSILNCKVRTVESFTLCGLTYRLSEDISSGVNLSIYDYIVLKVKLQSPQLNPKLKVSFRNFNEHYSTTSDPVSLKFNTISFNPMDYPDNVPIPLTVFQVDNWWVEQYKIDFKYSSQDISNVSLVEFITQDLKQVGNYQIDVEEVTLYGELVSEINLLKIVLLLWLISAIVLIIRQKNVYSRSSSTDIVTGTLNRSGIKQYIENTVLPAKPAANDFLTYIEINNYTKIETTLGHVVGDELVVTFTRILADLLKKKYKAKYKLSRLQQGEFCLLLSLNDQSEADHFIKSILAKYQQPLMIKKHKIYINISIGGVAIDEHIHNFESIMLRANSAINYATKHTGCEYKIFDDSVADEIFFRKSVVEKIKSVLENNEFSLNYMPIVTSSNLNTEHVEVLLRSQSKTMSGIGPDIFIPIAEEYDLIEQIDFWVIESVFKQLQDASACLDSFSIVFCINISASQLHNHDFAQKLAQLLKSYQINPELIELEITETSLIEIDNRSIQILKDVKALGVKLALDDFGTGYTAFNQLINYPVDCLKIDKSFVDRVDMHSPSHEAMIKAIISIAKSYNLVTVAEGVETQQQYKLLKEYGCDMLQGYYFSKPLNWLDFIDYMQSSIKTNKQENLNKVKKLHGLIH